MATSIADVCVFVRATKMCMLVLLCVCFFVDNHVLSQTGIESDQKTCDVLYRDGVEAYLDERWQDCVDNLELALSSYRVLKDTTVNCRLKCQSEADESSFMGPRNIEDLQFYDKMIRKTLCLLRCNKHDPKGGLNAIPTHVEQEFEDLKPYEYLQLCYYQKNMLQKAASAVFTFLVTHPDNEVMRDNLKFYSNLPEVDIDSVENFEARKYVSLYIRGSDAYQNEDYKAVIGFIEESLEDILRAEEECRAYCEGPFDQGWYPDFVSSIANHFTYCLKCKRRCPDKLKSLNGEEHHDLLPSHYHFLQYAYYKVGDMKKACKAVASYLLFFPGDETMLNNKDYYLKLPKVQKEYFTPREEAVKYVARMEYENKLLHFIETEFVFQESTRNGTEDKIEKKSSVARPKDNLIIAAISKLKLFPPPVVKFEWPKYETNTKVNTEEKVKKINKIHKEKNDYNRGAKNPDEKKVQDDIRKRKKRAVEQMQRAAAKNITAVMGEKNLHGKYRFVAEGFANSSDCNKLMELAQIAAVQGDGYSDNKSPHTNFERFEGVSLGRAALLVYLGLIEAETLELYLGLSELGRDYVERYFNLKSELYFTYTHLVCRSALRDSPQNRSDMSHAVHADNCNLLENGDCPKIPPAYTWRDFSAILYLNEDFEGGEFIFASDITAKHIQSLVKPRCGRMVGFSAGSENLHGVHGVKRGRRCALGLWFTFNPMYEEIERILARHVLNQVQQGGSITDQLLQELRKHVFEASGSEFNISNQIPVSKTNIKGQLKFLNKYVKETLTTEEELRGTGTASCSESSKIYIRKAQGQKCS